MTFREMRAGKYVCAARIGRSMMRPISISLIRLASSSPPVDIIAGVSRANIVVGDNENGMINRRAEWLPGRYLIAGAGCAHHFLLTISMIHRDNREDQ